MTITDNKALSVPLYFFIVFLKLQLISVGFSFKTNGVSIRRGRPRERTKYNGEKKLKFQSPRYPNIHSSPYLEKLLAKTDIVVGFVFVHVACIYDRGH